MSEPLDVEAIEARLEAAHRMVSALCKPQGTEGARRWIMSIPARPNDDPDLVIGQALRDGNDLIAEVRRLRELTNDIDTTIRGRAWREPR